MEILQDLTGIYIAVLEDTSKACNHCICIDGTRKLIFDSAESTSITLNKINLNVCCGKEGDFLNIKSCARIVKKRVTKKLKKGIHYK